MGARFISDALRGMHGVSNCVVTGGEIEFSFDYRAMGELNANSFSAYVPTRNDYEVSVAIVEKAIRKGCNLIVYDSWIFPTMSGVQHAKAKGVPVLSVGEFLGAINRKEGLDV